MTTRKPIPHHVNPPHKAPGQPIARAPYNFVPLPQEIYTVDDGIEINVQRDGRTVKKQVKPWEHHDEFVDGTHSGWIDLTIEALTPIFIRGAVGQENGAWDSRDSRLRSTPYLDHHGRPVIPGSTLRGMIRNLVEILSYSKIQPVSNKRPYFRTVSDDRIGTAYRGLVLKNGSKPVAGFMERRDDDWVIVSADEVLRVPRTIAPEQFNYRQHPQYHPDWRWQQAECWFQRGSRFDANAIAFANPNSTAWEAGIAVLTGSAPKKKAEFLFVGRDESQVINVPADLVNRFHDDDQITSWQQDAFPVDCPERHSRRRAGQLRDGEPIFYVCDPSKVSDDNPQGLVFFGRAQMFRFPYDRTPAELIPAHLRSKEVGGDSPASDPGCELGTAGLDLAEAMFGRVQVNRNDPLPTIKGRVFCEDCSVTEDGEWLERQELIPLILASPQVTAYQQYLTQDGEKPANEHTTYIANDQTTIRGHKLYWHRWEDGRGIEQVRNTNSKAPESQLTRIRAVAAKRPDGTATTFIGRVRFDNLTDIELGALLSALKLPAGCAHKIGMGKPLGLGSIHIDAKLNLIERVPRYSRWNDNGITFVSDLTQFNTAFNNAMLNHGRTTGEATIASHPNSQLRHLARLDALFTILRWENRPPHGETRYMRIEDGDTKLYPPDNKGKVNEFRTRPVLPTPHAITGGQGHEWATKEPDWPGPKPTPAADSPSPPPQSKAIGSQGATGSRTIPSKPTKLEKGQRYEASVDRIKKRKIEVHVELADGNWKCGWIENASDVPDAMRDPNTMLPVEFMQSTATGCVFRFVPGE